MEVLSRAVTDVFLRKKIIAEEEKEVYQFGVCIFLNEAMTFLLIFIFSALIWEVKDAILFLCTFCGMRIYCGGYHARKVSLCRIAMITTFIVVMIASMLLSNASLKAVAVIEFVSFLVLLPIIPVKHPNKTMTKELARKGKRRGILLYCAFALVSFIALKSGCRHEAMIIVMSLCAVAVLAVIGTISNRKEMNGK